MGAVADVAFGSPTARKGRGRRNVAILPIRSGDLRFLTARHRCEDEPFVSTLRSRRDARRSVVETQRGRRSGPGRVGAASHADRPQARLEVCGLRNSSAAETRFLLYLLLCATSACGGDSGLVSGTWCNEPGRELDLLISTMAIGTIAAFVVWLVRGRQLQRWNLREVARCAPNDGNSVDYSSVRRRPYCPAVALGVRRGTVRPGPERRQTSCTCGSEYYLPRRRA